MLLEALPSSATKEQIFKDQVSSAFITLYFNLNPSLITPTRNGIISVFTWKDVVL